MRDGRVSHELDHLLGLICCREGEIGAGVGYLQRAVEAAPANLGYKVMLARALVDAGRPTEALSIAERATGSSPAELALMQVGAEAAERLGDMKRSAACYRRLADALPNDWRVWHNLGRALAAQGDRHAAVEALSKAAALKPDDPLLQRALAGALHAAGRLEESARILEGVLVRNPADWDARGDLASVLADAGLHEQACDHFAVALREHPARGDIAIAYARSLVALARFAEAEAVYRQLLAADPTDATATHELGLLLERTSQMPELAELLRSARAAGSDEIQLAYLSAALSLRRGRAEDAERSLELWPADRDPVRWHRLRSKIADARGDAGQAFISAEAMNRSVANYDEWRRRGAEYRKTLRETGQAITAQWCASLPHLPADPRTPAFIVGFPRSGTTLLDTFLMGHPDVHVVEEVPMLSAAELVIGQQAALPGCSAEKLAQARAAYFELLERNVPRSFAGLVVDKLPLNILGAPLINALFPGARIIFSLRHPCDAVLSGFMQSFVLNEAMACFLAIDDAADLYDAVMDGWQRSRSNLPLDVHTLRYEELVADPANVLGALTAFLGLDWSDRVLDHQATANARGPVSTPSYDQITQPLTSRPSGRWRDYRREMAPVLPTLLKWAEVFGYSNRA